MLTYFSSNDENSLKLLTPTRYDGLQVNGVKYVAK